MVLFHSAAQASFNLKKLRDGFSANEWEWRAARLLEVDQSAIYVRRRGEGGDLL